MSSRKKSTGRGAQAPLLGSELQVSIEKLAVGGAGVARHEGFVFFVADAAPGDELSVEITALKKNFGEARIRRILNGGPARRAPPCPVADRCGGCNWQHIAEEEQRRQKELLVKETLEKFLRGQDFEYLPLKECAQSLRYRNRIQPKFTRQAFGFYARGSHEIVDIQDCPITEKALAQEIPAARTWAQSQKSEGRIEMYLDREQRAHFTFTDQNDEGFGFSQVNRFQNEDLVAAVLDWTRGAEYRHIFDLYAGAGNFSFPLMQTLNRPLTAVELSEKLVGKGRELNRFSDLEFVHSDVEKYLRRTRITPEDLVVLDPPRAGCSEDVMRMLAKARPRKIVYISCHPVSLARDLKRFFEFTGKNASTTPMKLRRVQAFEMFPQTDHVETIVELEG